MVNRFVKVAVTGRGADRHRSLYDRQSLHARDSRPARPRRARASAQPPARSSACSRRATSCENALIGAGVGALAGGGVGYYMDVQEAKLRQRLEGTGVSVTRMGDNITLNMPSNITFALNSADLNAQFFNALDGVSMVLKEYDKTVIEVAGHTDSTRQRSVQPGAVGAPRAGGRRLSGEPRREERSA